GVPKHRLTGRLKGELPSGGFARFEWQTVSDFFVDNANSVENDSYTATQLVVGKKGRADALEWEVFLGIDNLLDETFNANTRINAQNGRFFEPAPPFNVFGGLAL
ncbi:MAG: TonB-dependent receptor, partial [Nitrospinaceae bacterium]|nr:TonB-dependent receptor [Nitrospinaceae bacterium]NIR55783.1 TonB-dependent receptor [Nitrospinaceae bacterium]NIS86235.1 TonB-dependent receptor [Nitrospinaceae bacterium]NIT83066.1 TonB-dependent receptor [Nitrospinaceae bacterium]NIU45276.1 TonB-dependent receptor [Nitrospinaceae bacterium]